MNPNGHGPASRWHILADRSRCQRCGLENPCECTDDGQRVPLGVAQQAATERIGARTGWSA